MAVIATDVQRVSNIVKHVYEPSTGYCYERVQVTIPAGGYKIGTVLDNAGALVLVATTANASYVIVDEGVETLPAGVAKVLCLARGPAILADNLTYGSDVNDNTKKGAVKAALAAKGIVVTNQA